MLHSDMTSHWRTIYGELFLVTSCVMIQFYIHLETTFIVHFIQIHSTVTMRLSGKEDLCIKYLKKRLTVIVYVW